MSLSAVANDRASRDIWLDQLKAIAIIAVVFIHVGLPFSGSCRFCVPVFITIWAWNYERGIARRSVNEGFRYTGLRLLAIIAPYVFWTLVYCLVFRSLRDWRTTSLHTIVGGWFGGYGWPGQYFLVILLQLTILFHCLRRSITPQSFWWYVLVGSVGNAFIAYYCFDNYYLSRLGDRFFLYWLPQCSLGIAMARGYVELRIWLMFVAVVSLSIAELELSAFHSMSPYLVPSVTIGSLSICLSVGPGFCRESNALKHPQLRRFARISTGVGRQSMAIFLIHNLIVHALLGLGIVASATPILGGAMKLVIAAFSIAASMVIAGCFRRMGLGLLVGL